MNRTLKFRGWILGAVAEYRQKQTPAALYRLVHALELSLLDEEAWPDSLRTHLRDLFGALEEIYAWQAQPERAEADWDWRVGVESALLELEGLCQSDA